MAVRAIVAMDESRGIGKDGAIPWHIPADMKRFKSLTMGQTVVMGRKTYESLPAAFRPLPGRHTVVVSRNQDYVVPEGVELVGNPTLWLEQVLAGTRSVQGEDVWVAGGEGIYSLLLPLCDEVVLTCVEGVHPADTWFPEFETEFELISTEANEGFSYKLYKRGS